LVIGLIYAGLLYALIFVPRARAENCNASVNFDIDPKIVTSVNDSITLTATLTITNPQACQAGFNSIGADFQFYWTSGHSTLISSGWTVLNLSGSSTFTKSGSITTRLADLGFTTTQSSISFYARIQGYGLRAGETQKTDAIIYDPARYKFDVTSSTVNLGVNQTPAPVRKYSCVNNRCQPDENGRYSGIESCLSVCEGGAFTPPPSSTQTYVFNLPNPIGVTTFQDLINIIGRWIFNLSIPIAVIVIIWSGVVMLTSGGNAGRFKKGYTTLWYAVIGLAIVLIGKGFVTLIQSILNLRNR
jgi:hypothetical protein